VKVATGSKCLIYMKSGNMVGEIINKIGKYRNFHIVSIETVSTLHILRIKHYFVPKFFNKSLSAEI